MSNSIKKRASIQSGFEIIKSEKHYSQKKTVQKLAQIGCEFGTASFNKILKGRSIGDTVINSIFEGIQILLKQEFCYQLSENFEWKKIENCHPTEIQVPTEKPTNSGFQFHKLGRLSIEKKVAFFANAQSEVIEFGTTLHTFSNYFISRRPSDFKIPVQNLLERGVHFKCYLLAPDWQGTRIYFDDRQSPIDKDGSEKILNSLRKLKMVVQDFEKENRKGKFEIFTYRHFPHNYFMGVDIKKKEIAKMMISNYLYKTPRAHCPVMEFSRQAEPQLFLCYKNSLEALISDARRVDFTKIKS